MKNLFASALVLLVLCASPALDTATARAEDVPAANQVARFKILGMVTKNCPVLVKAAVSRIPGVKRVSANLETKTAEVEYAPGETSPAVIVKVIKQKVGFDAQLVD